MVVTTGAVRYAKLQSVRRCQPTYQHPPVYRPDALCCPPNSVEALSGNFKAWKVLENQRVLELVIEFCAFSYHYTGACWQTDKVSYIIVH